MLIDRGVFIREFTGFDVVVGNGSIELLFRICQQTKHRVVCLQEGGGCSILIIICMEQGLGFFKSFESYLLPNSGT